MARRTGKGRVPSPQVAQLLAEAREAYLLAAELRANMPTPLGYEPDAEEHSPEPQEQ